MLGIDGVQQLALPRLPRMAAAGKECEEHGTLSKSAKHSLMVTLLLRRLLRRFYLPPPWLILQFFGRTRDRGYCRASSCSGCSYFCCYPVAVGQTVDSQKAAVIFQRSCIGCHDGGGNVIQPGATLFSQDLTRNGVYTEEEIYRVTYYGKSRMPGFGESCTPRGQCTFGPRLTEDEIRLLAQFVKAQADQGWPKVLQPERE